jgi:hypothetical protein
LALALALTTFVPLVAEVGINEDALAAAAAVLPLLAM